MTLTDKYMIDQASKPHILCRASLLDITLVKLVLCVNPKEISFRTWFHHHFFEGQKFQSLFWTKFVSDDRFLILLLWNNLLTMKKWEMNYLLSFCRIADFISDFSLSNPLIKYLLNNFAKFSIDFSDHKISLYQLIHAVYLLKYFLNDNTL